MVVASEDLAAWARDLARRYLDVPRFRGARWPHVQAVAAKATALSPSYGSDGDLLVAAACLHDIGYAPELAVTGFHPLDGARFVAGSALSGSPAWSPITLAPPAKQSYVAWLRSWPSSTTSAARSATRCGRAT